jgi:hypothetical protein
VKKISKKRSIFGGNIKMRTEDYRKSLFKRLKDPEYAVGYLTEVLANES